MDILNELNKEQKKAVAHTEGPTIILAGAGSGKTRVLVYKVLYLITTRGVSAENILMVTFTNKAANEMKERIGSYLFDHPDISSHIPTVGTFHSLCARILRKEGNRIGIPPSFLIFDTQDQVQVIKDVMNKLDISPKKLRPHSVLHAISQAKNQLIDNKTYSSIARGNFQEQVASIYSQYQEQLTIQDALDFDDLLVKTIALFKTALPTLEKYQDQYKYILVDEYQDTNSAQFILTKLLSGKYKNVCIVGDFSQSIYSFRGADFRNLEKFLSTYPNAKEFRLSQNYRSTQNILDAASTVISKNNSHPVLHLWTDNASGEDIQIIQCEDEHNEAEFIIKTIQNRQMLDHNFSLSDVAVLYRMNAQSRALEETFLHYSIPYTLVGGTRFYERKEIKDILSYLFFLANPKNTVAFGRIEKLGKKRAKEFDEYVKKTRENPHWDKDATIDLLDKIISETKYLDRFDQTIPEDKARLENIKELRSVAIQFPNLIDFLENVALVEQESSPIFENETSGRVTLMTMHAAKGLEYKTVFVIGMEEGIFPHSQSLFDHEGLEEERRLCYVGITRAKELLYLTYTKRRLFFGQRVSNQISRFIFELPQDILEKNSIDIYDEPGYI